MTASADSFSTTAFDWIRANSTDTHKVSPIYASPEARTKSRHNERLIRKVGHSGPRAFGHTPSAGVEQYRNSSNETRPIAPSLSQSALNVCEYVCVCVCAIITLRQRYYAGMVSPIVSRSSERGFAVSEVGDSLSNHFLSRLARAPPSVEAARARRALPISPLASASFIIDVRARGELRNRRLIPRRLTTLSKATAALLRDSATANVPDLFIQHARPRAPRFKTRFRCCRARCASSPWIVDRFEAVVVVVAVDRQTTTMVIGCDPGLLSFPLSNGLVSILIVYRTSRGVTEETVLPTTSVARFLRSARLFMDYKSRAIYLSTLYAKPIAAFHAIPRGNEAALACARFAAIIRDPSGGRVSAVRVTTCSRRANRQRNDQR